MDSSLWFYTINLGWSIVYMEGSQTIISKFNLFISQQVVFIILANSVDFDGMLHYVKLSKMFLLKKISFYP